MVVFVVDSNHYSQLFQFTVNLTEISPTSLADIAIGLDAHEEKDVHISSFRATVWAVARRIVFKVGGKFFGHGQNHEANTGS
jgi:hypothetical protein